MIYTFYSYRGGIGRSTSLANVAECFYLRGLKVIVVDWDLESPGLESYFLETIDGEQVVQSRPGLVDMLIEYRRSFADTPPSDDEAGAQPSADTDFATTLDQRMPALSTYLVPIRSADTDSGHGGSLSLLPAGLRSDEHPLAYAQAVRALNWNELFASHHGKALFDWLRGKLLQAADVVLIDAPTGVSEAGGVCLRQLADVVVCFCTPIDEDLDAIANMVERSRSAETIEARDLRPLETVVVPVLLVEPQPEEVSELERRLDRLADTLPKPLQEQGLRLWDVRMPYHPQLSFREQLFVGREGSGADASEPMEAVYWTLASRLSLLAPAGHAIARPFERAQETSPPASPEPEIVPPAVPVIEQSEAAPAEEAAPVAASSVEEPAPVAVSPVEATPPVATPSIEVAPLADAASPVEVAPSDENPSPAEAAPAAPADTGSAAPVESEPPKRVPAARPTSIEPSVPPVAAPEVAGIRLPPAWGWPTAAVSALFLGVVLYLGVRGSSGDRAAAERAPEVKPTNTTEMRSPISDPPAAIGTTQPPAQERTDRAAADIGAGQLVAAPPLDPSAPPGLYLRVGRGPSCPRIVNYQKQFLAAGMEDAKAVTLKSGGCALVLGPYAADIVERRRKEHNARHIRGFDTAVTVDNSDFDKLLASGAPSK